MNLQEQISRIQEMMGLEELYDPSGKRYEPSRYVFHKASPAFRKSIYKNGLELSVGICYQGFVGEDIDCEPAIFATDSGNEYDLFYTGFDDDVWKIDTKKANVKWYKDKHYKGDRTIWGEKYKHIVTFKPIGPECLELIVKGSGKKYK